LSEILSLGCATVEHSEAFDSWYSEESSGDMPELYNGHHNCSGKHRITIPTGFLPLFYYAVNMVHK